MKMQTVDRMILIVDRLMETGAVSKHRLAEEMGVSERQVRRDFAYLEENGIFDLGTVVLEYDPVRNMHVASPETVTKIQKWRIRKAGAAAENRTKASPLGETRMVRLDSEWIVHKSYAREEFLPKVYTTLITAMKGHRLISFRYMNSKNDDERVVAPLKLVKYGELWYFYAVYPNSHSRRIYTFNLSRVTSVRMLDEQAPEDPDIEKKIDDVIASYGIFHGKGSPRTYRIKFTGWAADNVDAQIWQENQTKEWNDEGDTLYLSLPVANDTELMGRILFYGDCAEPLEPEDFVEKYREECRKMADRFNG